MWLINGHTVVNGSRYKLTYDGMYHMDIPKTRQYDTGKVEVIARSSVGEAIAETELKVIPRQDDYRGVLKNSPRRKCCNNMQQTYDLMHIKHAKYQTNRFNTPNLYTNSFKVLPYLLLRSTTAFSAEFKQVCLCLIRC